MHPPDRHCCYLSVYLYFTCSDPFVQAATLHTTQPPGGHYQGAQAYSSQRNSTPNSTTMMTAASVVPRLSQKVKVDEVGSPGEMTSQAFWDPKTVPSHPSVVDLGPAYRMSKSLCPCVPVSLCPCVPVSLCPWIRNLWCKVVFLYEPQSHHSVHGPHLAISFFLFTYPTLDQ